MRLGLYGGSFDPIHWGHLLPVRQARRELDLDRVLYLPTARPPHKPGRAQAPAWARYAMVELALLGEEGMYASTLEMDPDTTSYTIRTLEHFRRETPQARLFLVLGSDSFAALPTWREWRRILATAEIAILRRPQHELRTEELAPELGAALASGRARQVSNRPAPFSSTEVRRKIAASAGEASAMLPPLVLDYVEKYDLYRTDRS